MVRVRGFVAAGCAVGAAAFVPSGGLGQRVSLARPASEASCNDCDSWSPYSANCKPCTDDSGSVYVNDKLLSSKDLREVEVLSAAGQRQQLLSVIGSATPAVVVFLRHLG